MDGRRRLQYPRRFLKKRGDKSSIQSNNKCDRIIKVLLENLKADQNTFFTDMEFLNHLKARVYFLPMTYICSHSTFLVANGYNGQWQGEPWHAFPVWAIFVLTCKGLMLVAI